MTTVTVFEATKPLDLSNRDAIEETLAELPIAFKTHAGIMWSDKDGGMGDDPTVLVINTLTERLSYANPRLVFCSNRWLVLSALSNRDASGTLQSIKKYYILVDQTCSI